MTIYNQHYNALIIGGGFFGCSLGIKLKETLPNVLICEMNADLLQRASYGNQARVHNGYHYPRSFITALRCRVNFPRFIQDYPECIDTSFDKYYAVGRLFSKVSANQFKLFMQRIGAEISPAPEHIKKLFNPRLIEEVFSVKEYAFDAVKLKEQVMHDLQNHAVDLSFNTTVKTISSLPDGRLRVSLHPSSDPSLTQEVIADQVYNCTYAHINQINSQSQLPMIHLKHELTEMALVNLPDALKNLGITVMCGPFFSFMPFPARKMHTLSHVRYTPHHEWLDEPDKPWLDAYQHMQATPKFSNYPRMIRDVQRYIPLMAEAEYVDSIWEVKTILPRSEQDDDRPILLKKDYFLPNYTCIMGGKIDNIYDVFAELGLEGTK